MRPPWFISLLLLLLKHVSCINLIEGYEFSKSRSSGVNVKVNSGFEYPNGFSVCIRVMFYFVNWNIIFGSQDTVSLALEDLNPGSGIIRVSFSFTFSKIAAKSSERDEKIGQRATIEVF